MTFKMMTNPARDLVPEHSKRMSVDRARVGELHPDIAAAYEYVNSVVDVAIYEGGHAWHGWSLREAFLAGASYEEAKKKPPSARPVPLFQKTARDPWGMGDGCQAWFDVDQTRFQGLCAQCVTPLVCVRDRDCVQGLP